LATRKPSRSEAEHAAAYSRLMEINIPTTTLEAQLGGGVYLMPPYQRPFEWKEDLFTDLWDDIDAARTAGDEHFIGTILLSSRYEDEEPPAQARAANPRYVVDGQQRLVTLSILLAVIRARLVALELPDDPDRRRNEEALRARLEQWLMMLDPLLEAPTALPRIVLNELRSRTAYAGVLGAGAWPPGDTPQGSRDAARQITRASEFFVRKINTLVAGRSDDETRAVLRELVNTIGRRLPLIEIVVGSNEDAFVIFESNNAKREDLTQADLIKVLIFAQAKRLDRQRGVDETSTSVTSNWAASVETMEATAQNFTTFLRHYWLGRGDFVRTSQLYTSVRNNIRGIAIPSVTLTPAGAAAQLAEFVEDIAVNASRYVWLWTGTGEPPYPPSALVSRCRTYLDGVRAFGVSQALPLLLAALRNGVTPADFERLCAALEKTAIRRSLANQPANDIEQGAKEWCRWLRDEADKAAQTTLIVTALNALAAQGQQPSPFRTADVTSPQAKHVLLRLENVQRRAAMSEEEEGASVEVEHILPTSPRAGEWIAAEWTPDARARYISRLGNLTLLGLYANRSIKNRRYNCGQGQPTTRADGAITCCKQHCYVPSTVTLTNEVPNAHPLWLPEDVDTRQLRLADLADALWSI
jgi:hypothetical protein